MRFDYYYGSQADQFSFIRIPRVMIKDPVFAGLSAYAKLLYSVLLDRMSLSSKNGWFDEENRVYIVYPVTEAQEDLGIGKKKAMEVIAELVEFGLLEKKRRGQGLPSLLYVKSFMTGIDSNKKEPVEQVYSDVPELTVSSSARTEVSERASQVVDSTESEVPEWESQGTGLTGSEVSKREPQESGMNESEVSEMALQKPTEPVQQGPARLTDAAETALSAKELYETDYTVQHGLVGSEVSKRALPEVPESTLPEVSKPALLEVPKSAPLMSKTDNNNTYRSYTSSHHINTGSAVQSGKSDGMRCDENAAQTIRAYRDLIHENIRYDDLCAERRFDRERIDGIVDLILETVLGKGDEVRIASNLYPAEIVRSKFLKLGYEHIEYVLDCLDANTTKVRNIKKYLLAALFNAPSTMKGYYQAEVNHDMPQYAKTTQYA